MWPWILIAVLCLLLMLIMVLLYRRSTLAASVRTTGGELPPIEEVAALLEELEDAGKAIIDRMESKKAEVDAMLRLLDAKLDLLQLALQAKPVEDSPMPATNRKQEDDRAREFAEAGGRHEQIKALVAAGLDPLAIAQRTGMRLDEVRLVISLLASQCKSTT